MVTRHALRSGPATLSIERCLIAPPQPRHTGVVAFVLWPRTRRIAFGPSTPFLKPKTQNPKSEMRPSARSLLVAFAFLILTAHTAFAEPLALHPDNPHYFLFRGKPAVLVTSGEHYGAVLNLD